jgi:hypothetical protein
MNRYARPVCGDPTGQPFEILFDTLEAAFAHMERLREADLVSLRGDSTPPAHLMP